MKVIYDIDEIVAIPVKNIKEFRIIHSNFTYAVEVSYTICSGLKAIVFKADSREECKEFIENI